MDIRSIRQKIITFLFPVCVIGGLGGGLLWGILHTYYLDTSALTIDLAESSSVTLTVDAHIIAIDIPIPDLLGYMMKLLSREQKSPTGDAYPLRLGWSWSRQIECGVSCTITDIPAGSAVLTIRTETGGMTQERLFISPDTRGTLDLRPTIQTTLVTDITPFLAPPLTPEEQALLPGEADFVEKFAGLSLYRTSAGIQVYDRSTKQLITLPGAIDTQRITRGTADGEYLLITGSRIYSYDRYGRTGLHEITSQKLGDTTVSWGNGTTTLTVQKNTLTLEGIWWLWEKEGKVYLADGSSAKILLIGL